MNRPMRTVSAFAITALALGCMQTSWAYSDFKIDSAKWDREDSKLTIKGEGREGRTVTVSDAGTLALIGTDEVDDDEWRVRGRNPASVPCRVRAEQSDGRWDERDVEEAPSDCVAGGEPSNFKIDSAKWDSEDSKLKIKGEGRDGRTVTVSNAGTLALIGTDEVDDDDWRVRRRNPASVPCRVRAEQSDGQWDERDVEEAPPDCAAGGEPPPPPPPPPTEVSINSTSQNGFPSSPVLEQSLVNENGYSIFAINDLGMHCGDLDTRVSSILPPFNVLHATVVQKGSTPKVLKPADGISVIYSASSNPNDPILSGVNSAGSGPVASSMLSDGSVYKTNFWDIARIAYNAFYPPGILPAFYPPGANIVDLGLPMPNVERFYLGDGVLAADQQAMPGIHGPYMDNSAELFEAFVIDQPFFINPAFKFGYVKEGVNWFEAPGIPLTAYDDFGRENPWPLFRVQAVDAGGTALASNDTVVPISGEANCGACHNAPVDGGNGAATDVLGGNAATILDDPQLDGVPLDVSLEYAADLNVLRLHDQKHGTTLEADKPVVCQKCHYTPALDLAQLGPLGPENDPGNTLHNGRDQIKHKSMSNVMHSHHGSVTDASGTKLFPDMPAAIKDEFGVVLNIPQRRAALDATCYQCHPGRRTDCLRGAMANGGMLCQDCHGDMEQVGSDFTRNVSPGNPGAFELGGDFYTNANQPRVPWANEPGCGSCHTGDAMDSLAGSADVVVNPADTDANIDGIRLFQAFRTGDAKATPIVPTNKRFAENVIDANNPAVSGLADPRIGNPMLYRISTGHAGVFCEACHGATHGIWPNKNPAANDNVAAVQLQGHTGTVSECSACHTQDLGNTLGGPHGMHPVGNTSFSDGGHEDLAESDPDACRACHGTNGEGSVLSRVATDRTLFNEHETVTLAKGEPVTCTACHENEL